MKKKLGIFLYSMAAGGAERVVSILLPELAKRYDVTLILMNDTVDYPIPDDIDVIWLERSRADELGFLKFLKLPWLAWRLRQLAKRRQLDILFSLMNRPNYISSFARLLGMQASLIISERGTPSRQYADRSLQSRLNRRLVKILYPRADRVVTNSYGAAEDLIRNFLLPSGKLSVLYNPFDLAAIRRHCSKSDPADRSFVFISVGRLDEGKNHRLLLEAFAAIRQPDMVLWIVGEGPLRKALEERVKDLSLGSAVRFFGKVDPFPLLAKATVFVFASRREGLPNALIEALACDLPVISTDCMSGPREILADEKSYDSPTRGFRVARYGILVEENSVQAMAKAMKEVYNNDHLKENLTKIARHRAERFNISESVEKIISLIEEITKP